MEGGEGQSWRIDLKGGGGFMVRLGFGMGLGIEG